MRRLSNTQRAMLIAIARQPIGIACPNIRGVLDSLVALGLLTEDYRLTNAGLTAIDGFTRTVQP